MTRRRSNCGAMLYVHGGSESGVLKIMWADQEASRAPIVDTAGTYFSPRVSPDGKRVAFSAWTDSGFEFGVKDLERDTISRLSFLASRAAGCGALLAV